MSSILSNSTGYYEIYLDTNNHYRWRFKGNNHEIVAQGEAYYRRAGAENAVRLLKGSASAPVYDR